ncbi:MAG: hypothetical protein ACO3K7_00620 [Candidatus Marinamargulisbacteria bacterium]
MTTIEQKEDFSFDTLIDNVQKYAETYEKALTSLEKSASPDTDTENNTTPGSVNITDATVATTRVQITQSLTEMASGIAKNAATHTKDLGRKISS